LHAQKTKAAYNSGPHSVQVRSLRAFLLLRYLRQSYSCTPPLAKLQLIRVTLYFLNNVFLLNLVLKRRKASAIELPSGKLHFPNVNTFPSAK